MKKTTAIIFLILFSLTLPLFAEESDIHSFLASRHTENILPTDSKLGQLSDVSEHEGLLFLSDSLSHEFSFEWAETYLEENTRQAILDNMTNTLSEILPQSEMLFSKPYTNGDSSVSISVRFLNDSRILNFVVLNEKIIAITEK